MNLFSTDVLTFLHYSKPRLETGSFSTYTILQDLPTHKIKDLEKALGLMGNGLGGLFGLAETGPCFADALGTWYLNTSICLGVSSSIRTCNTHRTTTLKRIETNASFIQPLCVLSNSNDDMVCLALPQDTSRIKLRYATDGYTVLHSPGLCLTGQLQRK